MATLNLIPRHTYNVTYRSNYLNRNANFTGKFNNAQYGMLNFYDVNDWDKMATMTGVSPANIVSIHVYTNPNLPGGVNQNINSYGGKTKRNRRKYRLWTPIIFFLC